MENNKKDAAQVIAELTATNAELRQKVKELEKELWKRQHPVLKRALSVTDMMRMKKKTYPFQGDWEAAFGQPEQNGVWFIWGQSGNGKTSFVLQLCKELTKYGKVAYDSLEEGSSLTMRNALIRVGMADVSHRFVLLNQEKIPDLRARLRKKRAPDIVVIDSFQYSHMTYPEFEELAEEHKGKLIIFISQAEGSKPLGRTAISVMYAASLKIWVSGYRAFTKGRFFGSRGYYTIWKERAEEIYGKE